MTTAEDRRENQRFACDVEAVLETAGGQAIAARTQDISFSGVCVLADAPVERGTTVSFALRLILEWAETDRLVLPGQIVWCTRSRDGHQVGARFDRAAIDDATWQQLDVFLRFLSGDLRLPGPDSNTPPD